MKNSASELCISKPALFAQVGYSPHPLQLEIHLSPARRRVVAAGARFGKSVVAEYECLAAVLEPRTHSRGWVVGPTIDASDRILQHVRSVLEQHFPHRVRSYDPRTRTLVVTNLGGGRSELRAKSTDAAAGLLGESLTYVVCDEAAAVRQSDWEVCTQRLIDQRGWSLALSVPKGAGWFYDAFRMGQRNRDPDARSWTAPTSANPHVDRATIEAERGRLGEEGFREQFGGEFVGVESEQCMSCGQPDPAVSGCVVIEDDKVLAKCEECGHPIDSSGHTLVTRFPNGQATITVIRLCKRGEIVPLPLPTESNSAT